MLDGPRGRGGPRGGRMVSYGRPGAAVRVGGPGATDVFSWHKVTQIFHKI